MAGILHCVIVKKQENGCKKKQKYIIKPIAFFININYHVKILFADGF